MRKRRPIIILLLLPAVLALVLPARPALAARFLALYSAILRNDLAAVRQLTPGAGAINQVDRSTGATPLTWAAMHGIRPEITRWLLSRGADREKPDGEGNTPLTTAACYGNTGVVKVLLEAGADPNAADKQGRHPLVVASGRRGRIEILEALVKAGVAVQGLIGSHALEMALACGRKDLVAYLESLGARPSYFREIKRFYQE
ncbi:MAG: ankyrin repeat domain-containing protein [Thermodesulfobacteriota bacterium]